MELYEHQDIELKLTHEGAKIIHDALIYHRDSRVSDWDVISELLKTLRGKLYRATHDRIYKDRP